ncbi:hypothetical protein KI387_010141, partial [Taxus chinensis]
YGISWRISRPSALSSIPRKENEAADRLAAVGPMFDVVDNIKRDKEQPHIHIVVRPAVPDNNTCWQ